MDGHKHCRCCVQCPHCEITELRWAIDDDDVVCQHAAEPQCIGCDGVDAPCITTADPNLRDLYHGADRAGAYELIARAHGSAITSDRKAPTASRSTIPATSCRCALAITIMTAATCRAGRAWSISRVRSFIRRNGLIFLTTRASAWS